MTGPTAQLGRWVEFGIDASILALLGALVVLFGVRPIAWLLRVASDVAPEQQQQAADRLKGGAWIGALERLAAYVCVIAHFPAGLAVVMAVKGLARYPDLRSSDVAVSERFIIGTLASVLLAIGGAALALWLVSLT